LVKAGIRPITKMKNWKLQTFKDLVLYHIQKIRHARPEGAFIGYSVKLWMTYFICLGIMGISLLSVSFSGLPSFEELENPKYDLASIIYDVNGKQVGRYYIEDRVAIDYSDLSPVVRNALLATEDNRFFDHSGIDFQALFRVAFKTLLLQQDNSGGGSTITQQLAKLLYRRPDMSEMSAPSKMIVLIYSKLREWVIAVKLERSYSKEEIMTMYLNKFEFINGAHGIEAASQIYFSKNQQDLTPDEAAVLIGMLKNPSLYNPVRFPEKSLGRRNLVLNLMESEGHIEDDSLDIYIARPLDMSGFSRKTQSEGPAPYFRAELTKWLRDLFRKNNITKSDGTEYNVYTDGLKIRTTIDLNYQKLAEEAVLEHMQVNQKRFDQTWKNLDPWTYQADKAQKKLRATVLESQCKASKRYQGLRDKMMAAVLEEVDQKYGFNDISDRSLDILDSIYSGQTNWQKAAKSHALSDEFVKKYSPLISNSLWGRVSTAYKKLQVTYKEEFSTPVKMKVFDYASGVEKEVLMSPFDSVKYHRKHLQAGFLVMESATGHIKAWVGGVNHTYFKYDHATMRRSVGSTIKPFVYTQAMAVANISPCQEFEDIQYTITPSDAGFGLIEEWSPGNATESFSGARHNLFSGLLYSINSITVKLLKEMGTVAPVRDLLHNCGIDKDLRLPNGSLAVPSVPSICLGAVDLTLLEMTGAYSAFANNGTYVEPIFVSSIEDKNGKTIYKGAPKRTVAINPLYNAIMVSMLKNNVGGSMGGGVKSSVGGKTGTTNDYADGWFMGITPTLTMGTWTGGDDKWMRFLSLTYGQGSAMAKPIQKLFLQKLEADSSAGYNWKASFPNPPANFTDMVNCALYNNKQKSTSDNSGQSGSRVSESFDEEFE
jgi:penicillin-binding protein 1A